MQKRKTKRTFHPPPTRGKEDVGGRRGCPAVGRWMNRWGTQVAVAGIGNPLNRCGQGDELADGLCEKDRQALTKLRGGKRRKKTQQRWLSESGMRGEET
ncbi:hypothetical protein CVT25_011566 [Psilocybe cyanescens]|uniref:Uncharacterized protein n=1 Tax=Psilocybe cyanescens TaxID=93625 RepID=A0A409X0T0_PSICY|nr:hypothetical protein CVT25_011566 [Psilocybe cyanescens]